MGQGNVGAPPQVGGVTDQRYRTMYRSIDRKDSENAGRDGQDLLEFAHLEIGPSVRLARIKIHIDPYPSQSKATLCLWMERWETFVHIPPVLVGESSEDARVELVRLAVELTT